MRASRDFHQILHGIEVVRAIILGHIHFGVPSIVFPLGVIENLAENAPSKKIVYNFVINRNKAARFGGIMYTDESHKIYKFRKNRARDTPLRSNYIGKIPFFPVSGAVNPHP